MIFLKKKKQSYSILLICFLALNFASASEILTIMDKKGSDSIIEKPVPRFPDPDPRTPPPVTPPRKEKEKIFHENVIDGNGKEINTGDNLFAQFPLLEKEVNKIPNSGWNRIMNNLHIKWIEWKINKVINKIDLMEWEVKQKYEEISHDKKNITRESWQNLKDKFPLLKGEQACAEIDKKFQSDKWGKLDISFVEFKNMHSQEIELVEIKDFKFIKSIKDKISHDGKNKDKNWWEEIRKEFPKIADDYNFSLINREFWIDPEGNLDIRFTEFKIKETGETVKVVIEKWSFNDNKNWERIQLTEIRYSKLTLIAPVNERGNIRYIHFSYSGGDLLNGYKLDMAGEDWAESNKWAQKIRRFSDSNDQIRLKSILFLLYKGYLIWYIAIRELDYYRVN